jgi:glycosyltransferase involved in cell wall biosynthesis
MHTAPRHVVHVTQQLSPGGAGRAAMSLARESMALGGYHHTLISLQPPPRAAVRLAAAAGLPIVAAADPATIDRVVDDADLALVHFWNSPELYAFLRRPGPPRRTIAWLHVNGLAAPHVVTPAFVAHCDAVVATTSRSLSIPAVRAAVDAGRGSVISAVADAARLQATAPVHRSGFTVGTVCGLDFTKLHRDFIAICAAVRVPAARFVVCGDGPARQTLMAEAVRAGLGGRIEFRGHVEDVGAVLAGLDVFLYPLCPDNTTTCDLALQEAVLAGVPSVVMPHGGAADLVEHEATGLVAESVATCAAAVERLHADDSLRARLAAAAARRGRERHDPRQMATHMHAVFAAACGRPKRRACDPLPPAAPGWRVDPESGAARFVRSLGEHAAPFATSLATDATAAAAGLLASDAAIAGVGPLLAGAGGGGVLHYRGFHPDDAWLRLWSGLVWLGQGRPAFAALDFQAALRLGCDPERVRSHLNAAVAAARRPIAATAAPPIPTPHLLAG